jgi:molybdopterin converting factor small subunit
VGHEGAERADNVSMSHNHEAGVDEKLLLSDLPLDPRDEWRRLLAFVGWSDSDRRAATLSVECLLGRSRELVTATYDHLISVPETAAILSGPGTTTAEHLTERRAFLSVWLARTLGLDTSDEFALYLYRAGLLHAGLGPRRAQVPPGYLTATVGLVLAAFARFMAEEGISPAVMGPALAAWNRFLGVQLHTMLSGYHAAAALRSSPLDVRCTAYGRLRPLLSGRSVDLGMMPESAVRDALRILFRAHPAVRAEVLDAVWDERPIADSSQAQVTPVYVPRPGWRVLLNGRDVRYDGGLDARLAPGDQVAIFPPGR